MKTLDRYIIKKYLRSFFFATLIISVFSVVIDFSEKVGKFIDHSLGMKEIFLDYYLHFIPWINGLLWPLFALIAVIFFTSRMAKDSEIIPILNAGVSFRRLLVPYLITAVFISLLLWVGSNYVIPISSNLKNEFESTYLNRSRTRYLTTNVHFFLDPNSKIYIRYFRTRDSTATNFRLEKFDSTGRLNYYLKAGSIKFTSQPNNWTLEDYIIRKIDGLNEEIILGKGEKLDTQLNFTPSDFIQHTKQMEIMTTDDLREFIKKEEARGLDNTKKYYVELYRRSADPFTIIILTMIGVAVASRKVRGGMGLHLALGVIFGASYVLLSKFSTTFAINLTLSAWMGIWLPNIIFFFIAIIMCVYAQK